MATVKFTDLTAEQRIFYDSLLLDRALPQLQYNKWAVKKSIPSNGGIVIDFRRFELIDGSPTSITALTEGTAGASATPSTSHVYATIQQYGRYMEGTDILDDQSIDDVLTENTDMFGEQAGIDLDVVTRDVIAAGTTVQYASTAGSRGGVGSGMRISSAELREVLRTLQTANARPIENGKYIAVIHPNTWADLLNDTDFKASWQYAGPRDATNVLFSGGGAEYVADYLGIRFVMSSQAKVFSSYGMSGADVYATMFLCNQAYATSELDAQSMRIIYRPREIAGGALETTWTLGYKAAFAAVILNEDFLLRLEHTTTAHEAA